MAWKAVAVAAFKRIQPGLANQHVVAIAALHVVVARAAIQPIIVRAAINNMGIVRIDNEIRYLVNSPN